MIDRDFEKFRGGPTPSPSERIHVTLDKWHVIGLNENVYRLLGKPTAVYLYFSRSTDTIALEPLQHSRLTEAFPVKPKTPNVGWHVRASPFCRHFNIRVEGTQKFIAPDIRDGKLLLKLSETITVRNNRRKKQEVR
jgi:hypothetical protein